MAKECIDFTFLGKKLSSLPEHYLSVDFDQEKNLTFALGRSVEYTDLNSVRTEPNVSRTDFSDKLRFEVHLVKDPQFYPSQEERIITEPELRRLTRWITSTDTSQLLRFEYADDSYDETRLFRGQFTDIQPFVISAGLYGLRLVFECSTPFGYTEDIVNTVDCQGSRLITISNLSDDMNRCRYPRLDILPHVTGQGYLANLSDCQIYEQGVLSSSGTNVEKLAHLRTKLETYALAHGLSVHYQLDPLDSSQILTIGDDTALLFYFEDSNAKVTKCAALYHTSTASYYIIQGGFLYWNLSQNLPIHMDSQNVTLLDDIGRMISYDTIGMTDVDYFYWPRLRNGDNLLLFYAPDCQFTLTHNEVRKAGA